jgi:hypothetical protein
MHRTAILLLAPPLIGVLAGYVLGGRLAGLATVRLRALWLLWVATGVQASQYYLHPVREFLENRLGLPMLAIVFALVALWLGVNLSQPHGPPLRIAIVVILLGALSNGAAIVANGRMPYSTGAARVAGLPTDTVTPKNEPGHEETRVAFIGDVVPVPFLRKVISPGDVLISLGMVTAIAAAMRRRRSRSRRAVGEEVNHDLRPHAPPGAVGAVPDRIDRDPAVHDRRTQ